MTHTTIKVTRDLRDRLKRQASAEHRTLGEHLEHLASLAERQQRFTQLRKEIDATIPEHRASYQEETDWWETAQNA